MAMRDRVAPVTMKSDHSPGGPLSTCSPRHGPRLILDRPQVIRAKSDVSAVLISGFEARSRWPSTTPLASSQ